MIKAAIIKTTCRYDNWGDFVSKSIQDVDWKEFSEKEFDEYKKFCSYSDNYDIITPVTPLEGEFQKEFNEWKLRREEALKQTEKRKEREEKRKIAAEKNKKTLLKKKMAKIQEELNKIK